VIEVNLLHYLLTYITLSLLLLLFSGGTNRPARLIFAICLILPLVTGYLFFSDQKVSWYGPLILTRFSQQAVSIISLGCLLSVLYSGCQNLMRSIMANLMLAFTLVLLSANDFITFCLSLELLGLLTTVISVQSLMGTEPLQRRIDFVLIKQLHLLPLVLAVLLFYLATGTFSFREFTILNNYYYIMASVALLTALVAKLGLPPFQAVVGLIFKQDEQNPNLPRLLIEGVAVMVGFLGPMHQIVQNMHSEVREIFIIITLSVALIATLYGGLITIKEHTVEYSVAFLYMVSSAAVLPLLTIYNDPRVPYIVLFYMASMAISFALFLIGMKQLALGSGLLRLWAKKVKRQHWIWLVSVVISLGSISYFPFTPGFTMRLALYAALAEKHPAWAFCMIVAHLFTTIFTVKLLLPLFDGLSAESRRDSALDKLQISDTISLGVFSLVIIIGGVISLALIEILV
jgi:formate hydrogenlyase subunit 3/multisubunit Na+/H+ antiporter MnhD subunit